MFLRQWPSGQWPTLLVNVWEKKIKPVDTLAITAVIVYLAQLSRKVILDKFSLTKALDFIKNRCYINEIEGFQVWHFNSFYPPDWEDTAMAVYLLLKNGRLQLNQLEPLRKLLIQNTPENGTGVWVKDPYSKGNSKNNHWDPTTALNVLRLHCLLEVDKVIRVNLETFVKESLALKSFNKMTLYYTPPVAAFFAKQLLLDFPELQSNLGKSLEGFYKDVRLAVENNQIVATSFEKSLLGIKTVLSEYDPGLIFHHGRRFNIWYGSPMLYKLAQVI